MWYNKKRKERGQMERKHKIEFSTLIVMALGGVYALLAKNGYGIPCPIRALTGLLCPGCGNTRAALSLLRFDIIGMFEYNLMFPLEAAYMIRIYYVCSKTYIGGGKFSYYTTPKAIDIAFLVLLVVWTVVRNFL